MGNFIIVKYTDDYIFVTTNKKDKKLEYNVQFAGYKDTNPMCLEVWRIPCPTRAEASKLRDEISERKMIMTSKKIKTLKENTY